MNLDIERLTMGEIATIEKLGEASINNLGDDDTPKGKMLAALAMVQKRRTGTPDFKWGDALALTMAEVHDILGLDDEDDEDADEQPATDHAASDDDAGVVDEPPPGVRPPARRRSRAEREAADPT